MNAASYTSFNGARLSLYPWMGRRVCLLTRATGHDAKTIAKITDVFDRAADFYADVTAREPKPKCTLEGRITIAEVEGIGGAAWAWLGETGIEIQPQYLSTLLRGVQERDEFDQVLFYELGRNYWFWEGTLDLPGKGSVCTGYAVYMRLRAMEATGVRGGPYNQTWPFADFRAAIEGLLDRWIAKGATPGWVELLGGPGAAVATIEQKGLPPLALSSTDLVASLLGKLAGTNGGMDFLRRFCGAATQAPAAKNTRGTMGNFFACACAAAGRDLSAEFARWQWPVVIGVG